MSATGNGGAARVAGRPRECGGDAGAAPPFRGALAALSAADRARLLTRGALRDSAVRAGTAVVLARVRAEGDAALRVLMRRFHGVDLAALEVPRARRREALDELAPALRRALERARANIAVAHRAALPRPVEIETEPGIAVGRRPDPLARVGVYAPGGRAAYPSSVLMGAVPARVACVGEIVLCSPPGLDGFPSAVVLAAAELAGVDRVFALGGAAAIGAMAFGTASIPRVDRIVGPGNAWVAEAKLQVAGEVSIDSPAGPSELLVIADGYADADAVAREMLAQAEHDPHTCVVAVAVGEAAAGRIEAALARALPALERRGIAVAALAANGGVLSAVSLDEAVSFACDYAPEHLLLAVEDPEALLPRVRNAGTVFLGAASSVTFGDYMTGANHTLPTGGRARAYSGLSTLDFVRWTSYQRVSPEAAARLAPDVAVFAEAEGLPAHAAAARAWGVARGGPAGRAGRGAIDLSDNTNLFGAPPAARAALDGAGPDSLVHYPSAYADALRAALADYAEVAPHEIVTGCGSDDVLDSAFRALASPGDRVAFSAPTFSMIPAFARLSRLDPVAVPFGRGGDLDPEALLATEARILYLCTPNNPTGTAASRAAVELVLEGAKGYVVLDEAYAEFCGGAWIREAPRHPCLLVVRTLSKAFGLAGLRIGYGAGAAPLVAEVERARGPYKVGGLAERAAVAVLTRDRDWVRACAAEVVALRARFVAALEAAGFAPLPTAANFALVPVRDAAAAAEAMRLAGVTVRAFPALPGIGDALRITVGPWPMMEAALAALRAAAGPGAGGGG